MSRKLGVLFTILIAVSLILGACAQPTPATIVQTVEVIKTVEVPKEVIKTVEVPKEVVTTVEVPQEVKKRPHWRSNISALFEGTTWSGAQDRAAKRLVEKYPNVKYVYQGKRDARSIRALRGRDDRPGRQHRRG